MSMIKFTDSAVIHIKNLMAKEINAIGFRLSLKKTGCSGYSYVPEIANKITNTDLHFIAQDNLPVFIDPKLQEQIKELQVDYVEEVKNGLRQKRLIFTSPNEGNRCGCGESFTLEKSSDDV